MSTSEQPPGRANRFVQGKARRTWPRIVSGFAAGVVCTFLIVMFSREPAPPLGQLAKSVQEAPRTEAAPSSETKSAQPTQPTIEPSAQQAAQTPAAAPSPSPAPDATAARADKSGTTGAASPVDAAKAAPPAAATEPPRSVRVIPTDRNAAGKRVTVPAPSLNGTPADRNSARTTDGLGSSAAPAEQAKAGPSSDTQPSADTTSSRSSSREAREQRRAARERERQARREAERAERAERSDRRRTVRTEETDRNVTTPAFDDEVRFEREERRATRESRETSRSSRKRSTATREDDDDTVVVRRSRDGRELTVFEEPRRERPIETRRIIHEESARPRLPSFFDLFNPGGRED